MMPTKPHTCSTSFGTDFFIIRRRRLGVEVKNRARLQNAVSIKTFRQIKGVLTATPAHGFVGTIASSIHSGNLRSRRRRTTCLVDTSVGRSRCSDRHSHPHPSSTLRYRPQWSPRSPSTHHSTLGYAGTSSYVGSSEQFVTTPTRPHRPCSPTTSGCVLFSANLDNAVNKH